MKRLLLSIGVFLLASTVPTAASANDTGGYFQIAHLTFGGDHVVVQMESASGDNPCTLPDQWIVFTAHQNYDAMVSGLLAAFLSGKKVWVAGDGTCAPAGSLTREGIRYFTIE